jgi:hypothetical protein
MLLAAPLFRYDHPRNAYVLRVIGTHFGPVLRIDRRATRRAARHTRRASTA